MKTPMTVIWELNNTFHANLIGPYAIIQGRNTICIRFNHTDKYQRSQVEVQRHILCQRSPLNWNPDGY